MNAITYKNVVFYIGSIQELLNYADGCYHDGHYNECERVCLYLLEDEKLNSQKHQSEAALILGKSEYALYQKQKELSMAYEESLTEREMAIANESKCYRAKLIIDSLTKHDLKLDAELRKYVDHAMIECALSNELLDVKCCMLCLKYCQKLRRSHIVPKSILQEFRKAYLNFGGNRAFSMSNALDKHFTDKTLAKYMLCQSCETLLNVNGEEFFYNLFFKKIYDTSNVDCLALSHRLPYGKWLYHFCLGFIFRGIAAFCGIPNNVSSGKLYNFFLLCRQYLLNQDELLSEKLPKVQIFINQTVPPLEYREKWTPSDLVQPATFAMSNHRLIDGVITPYPVVNFILVKIGIINIIVDLADYSDGEPLQSSLIDPCGGIFFVPKEKDRILPVGLNELYTEISSNSRKKRQNFLFRKDQFAPKLAANAGAFTKAISSFKLADAVAEDKETFQEQMSKTGGLVFKCLPPQFVLDHKFSEVKFPSPYILLIHQNFDFPVDDDDDDDCCLEQYFLTIFIGVKNSEGSSLPFIVVYELQEDDYAMYFGYFFSPKDYSVQEYITDIPIDAYHYPTGERIQELTTELLPLAIESALVKRGFSNMSSLLFHYQHK